MLTNSHAELGGEVQCFALGAHYGKSQSHYHVPHLPSFMLKVEALNPSMTSELSPPSPLLFLFLLYVCKCVQMYARAHGGSAIALQALFVWFVL